MASLCARVWWTLACAYPLAGQTLNLSSGSGAPGESIELNLSMDSPPGKAATVLKWDTIFPAQLLELQGVGPEAGVAATQSGKSLTCTQRQAYIYVCILAGGQKPISNGRIASFRFKIRMDARSGSTTVRIDHVEAANKDLQAVKVVGGEGHVEIK